MAELKPCPFCGGEAQIRYFGKHSGVDGYTCNIYMRSEPALVRCVKCDIKTKRYSRACRVIEAWNRRAGETNG